MADEDWNTGALATRSESETVATIGETGERSWSVQALSIHAVQCRLCGKYRRVPEKQKYEEIREQLLSSPWECQFASEWNTEEMNCDVPDEFTSPEYVLLFDKPAIPVSPPLWKRECFLRKQISTRHADIYYYPPNGRTRIKSKKDIMRYCEKFPESLPSDFDVTRGTSFATPKAPPGMWMKKKWKKPNKCPWVGKTSLKKLLVRRTSKKGPKSDTVPMAEVRACEEEEEEEEQQQAEKLVDCEVKAITACGEKAEEAISMDTNFSEPFIVCRKSLIREFCSNDDEHGYRHEEAKPPTSSEVNSSVEYNLQRIRHLLEQLPDDYYYRLVDSLRSFRPPSS